MEQRPGILKIIVTTILYWIHQGVDAMHSGYLLLIRRDPYRMTDHKLAEIKRISHLVYPDMYCEYDELENAKETATKVMLCRPGKLYVLTGNDWYLILTRELTFIYLYDFASADGKCSDIFRIYRELIRMFRGRRGYMHCIETTSYPVLMALAGRGFLKITKDEPFITEDGVKMRKVFLRVRRKPAGKRIPGKTRKRQVKTI